MARLLDSDGMFKKSRLTPRWKIVIAYGVLVLAVFLAYLNTLYNAFLWDDYPLIVDNLYLRGWGHIGDLLTTSLMRGANIACSFYRPLQSLLYLIIYHLQGPQPFGFHLLNLCVHAANACLVYALGRKLGFGPIAVLLGALVWALHPLQTEAVTYISATADGLYVFFCLLSLIALLPDFTARKYLLALPLFILALLSKETASVFPLLAMSCVFLRAQARFRIQHYYRLWPLGLVAGIYIAIHLSIPQLAGFDLYRQPDAYTQNIWCRVYTFLATLPAYAQLLLWPAHLHPERSFPIFETPWHPQVLMGLSMMVIAAGLILRRQNRALGWGLLWFFAADFLHSGIVLPVNGVVMEHWMYLPTAGMFLGIAEGMGRYATATRMRVPAAMGAVVMIVALGLATYAQNATWHDPETFYSHMFASGDYLPRARNGLGSFYAARRDYVRALTQFGLAIEQSNDTLADSRYDYGVTLLRSSDAEAAIGQAMTQFRRALEIDPDLVQASSLLADLYAQQGDEAQADKYRRYTDRLNQKLLDRFAPHDAK